MGDVFARSSKAKDRDIRACFTEANAATAIGAISHGCEIYGLSKGAFSLVDILRHCLRYTGPAQSSGQRKPWTRRSILATGRADTDVRRAGMSYARTGARVRE